MPGQLTGAWLRAAACTCGRYRAEEFLPGKALAAILTSACRRCGAGPRAVAAVRAASVLSGPMSYMVRTERAGPRTLAAVRAVTTPQRLGADIVRLLDMVWPVLREQGVPTGHNVVVYYAAGVGSGALIVDAGVEVLTDFAGRGEVRPVRTPPGEVAATTHYGEYSDLAEAYTALQQWCAGHQRRAAGVNWEVYGDWDDDPAQRRTDVYFLLELAQR